MDGVRLRQIGVTAIVLALATLLVVSAVCFEEWRHFEVTAERVRTSQKILVANTKVEDGLQQMEAGQRGYLLTGRPADLALYHRALAAFPQQFGQLVALAGGRPAVQELLEQVRPLHQAKLAELTRELETGRVLTAESASGDPLSERIRQLFERLEASETLRWRAGWNELETCASRLIVVVLAGSVLLIIPVVIGVGAIRRDAIEMKQLAEERATAREQAQQSRDLFEATLYSIGDGVITTDHNGTVRLMNAVAEHLTGYKESEASGVGIERVFHIVNEATRNTVESPALRALQYGRVMELPNHTVLIDKEGREWPIDDSAALIAEGGRLNGAVLVFRDVTARKQATETALRLATIVEHSDDAIISKSLDGIVTSWNRAAERLFGYTEAEMVGQPIAKLIPANRHDDMTTILARIAQGELVDHYETERIAKDGRRLTVFLTVSPIRDAQGKVIGASKIARDITHQRELESLMRQTQKMEAMGRLAGGIAHDFNNLVTVILGYTKLVQKRLAEDDPLRRHMSEIAQAGERAASLTGQLLTFSRKQMIKPTNVDLAEWLGSARDMLERLIGDDIELLVLSDGGHSQVATDATQLTQILMNLAVNARDAMPLGGKLTIETRRVIREVDEVGRPSGEYVLLEVTDTGEGISPASAAHIFEPFFTTKGEGKGTGLGLSTVYGIVTAHRGWIDLKSEPGAGTAFQIYLPRATEVEEFVAPPDPLAAAEQKRVARILLVDDQPGIRRLAREILEDAGHEVLTAVNGVSAQLLAEEETRAIDLLVSDVIMPGISGAELAERMRRGRPGLRVLLMSGYGDDALEGRGVFTQGTLFLAKPFSPDDLVTRVGEALGQEVVQQ